MLVSKACKKYISIAGPSKSIDKTLVDQLNKKDPSIGSIALNHIKELKKTGKIENVNPMLFSLFKKQNQPFLISWMKYNPSEEIKKLTIPILIINGTKDLQVPVDDANALHKAVPKSSLAIINEMNHVLKSITKDEDNIKSYHNPNFPIPSALVNKVVSFITDKRTAR